VLTTAVRPFASSASILTRDRVKVGKVFSLLGCVSYTALCRVIFPCNYFVLRHLSAALHLAGVGQPLQVLKAIPPFFLATGFFIAVPPFLNRPGFSKFNTGIGWLCHRWPKTGHRQAPLVAAVRPDRSFRSPW
jgi:hypothetical protein